MDHPFEESAWDPRWYQGCTNIP